MEKCIYALEQALFFVKSNGNDAEIINYLELEIKKYKEDIKKKRKKKIPQLEGVLR